MNSERKKAGVRANVTRQGSTLRKLEDKLIGVASARVVQNAKKKNRNAGKATGGVPLSAPVAYAPQRLRPNLDIRPGPKHNSIRVSITDYIGPLSTPTGSGALPRGSKIFDQSFSPAQIPGSKLTTISSMYERYIVNRLLFHYSPASPTSVGASMIMAFDRDPSDAAFSGEPGIRHAIGLASMVNFAPWEAATMLVEKEDEQTIYFCSPAFGQTAEGRLEFTGNLFVIVSSPGSLEFDQNIGELWVEADITFYDPTWEPTDVNAVAYQPTDGGHTLSLVSNQGFSGMENDITLEETNIAFMEDGLMVGAAVGEVGFILPANNRFHVSDVFIGLQTTVRITGETLMARPLFNGRLTNDSANHAISINPEFESSDTSATQTNWTSTFIVTVPAEVQLNDPPLVAGSHYIQQWYLTASLVGTVGGTYTGRSVSIQRDAGYSRFNDVLVKRHRKRSQPKPADVTVGPTGAVLVARRKTGLTDAEDINTKFAGKDKGPSKPQWVKIQISSDSQQSGLSVTTDPE
jgi:hypothetical protein